MNPLITRTEYSREGTFLYQDHVDLIRASAISAEISSTRGYRTEESPKNLQSHGFNPAQCRTPGLLIPLYNVGGEPAGHQFRPNQPREREGKAVKYETPNGQANFLDIHPTVRDRLADPKIPLFITEGIRKSDALVSAGACAIGLLGVYGWRGRNTTGGLTALADWELVALKERVVHVVFDSDVVTKPAVRAALNRLKAFLEHRGASVRLIYLPFGRNGEKVGVDNFLASGRSIDDLLSLPTRDPPIAATARWERPCIEIVPGRRPWMVDEAERILADYKRWRLFQRGGSFCRVVVADFEEQTGDELLAQRPNGAVVLKQLDAPGLEDQLSRAISWCRRKVDGELVERDCPPKVAVAFLSRAGESRLPELTGVIEASTVLADGTILDSPGYHPGSGLYLYSQKRWGSIPDKPTRAEAIEAMRVLREPYAEFPFVSEADKSVIISEVLTGLVRRQLDAAPLHGHDAPAQEAARASSPIVPL